MRKLDRKDYMIMACMLMLGGGVSVAAFGVVYGLVWLVWAVLP